MERALERRAEARVLLEFSAAVARHRLERGRLVILENPWSSDAWEQPELEDVLLDPTVEFVRGDFCQWNKRDRESGKLLLKPTGFVVTKGALSKRLERRCTGDHDHERIQGSNKFGPRSVQAGVYPKALCEDIVMGALEELIARRSEKEVFAAEVEAMEVDSGPHEQGDGGRARQAAVKLVKH